MSISIIPTCSKKLSKKIGFLLTKENAYLQAAKTATLFVFLELSYRLNKIRIDFSTNQTKSELSVDQFLKQFGLNNVNISKAPNQINFQVFTVQTLTSSYKDSAKQTYIRASRAEYRDACFKALQKSLKSLNPIICQSHKSKWIEIDPITFFNHWMKSGLNFDQPKIENPLKIIVNSMKTVLTPAAAELIITIK